jgi:hypothetical protein
VDTALRDRDPVQGAVELAVAAAVEAVALVFAGARVEWRNAGVAGELRVGAEAIDRPDLAQQLGGAQGSAAGKLQQPRRDRGRTCVERAVKVCDRAAQAAAAAEQLARDPHLGRLLAPR